MFQMISCRLLNHVQKLPRLSKSVLFARPFSSSSNLKDVLENVSKGKLTPDEAFRLVSAAANNSDIDNDTELLQSFARIDHGRSKRTGFPEVVFAQGKTAHQVCAILDDMAKHVVAQAQQDDGDDKKSLLSAILATRCVSSSM
jgi:hypothetical protein